MAELRVDREPAPAPRPASREPAPRASRSAPEPAAPPDEDRDAELLSTLRASEARRGGGAERGRGNPFDELEVPRWGD
jgi:hypothetical protein